MTTPELGIRKQKGFRLSPEAQRILAAMAVKMGISQNAVLEIALRNVAKEDNIQLS